MHDLRTKRYSFCQYAMRTAPQLWALGAFMAISLVLSGCQPMSKAGDASSLLEKAEANIHEGNLQEAFKQLSKALSADPNNTAMHVDLGWVYAMTDQRDKAMKEISIVESLSPKNPDLAYLKGYLYAQEKQWLDALEYYDKALETDERNRPYVHADIADAFMQINEADAALKEYDVALRLDPDNSRYEFGRCQAYRQLKQFDASIAACKLALNHAVSDEERTNINDVIEGMTLLQQLNDEKKSAEQDTPSTPEEPPANSKDPHAEKDQVGSE